MLCTEIRSHQILEGKKKKFKICSQMAFQANVLHHNTSRVKGQKAILKRLPIQQVFLEGKRQTGGREMGWGEGLHPSKESLVPTEILSHKLSADSVQDCQGSTSSLQGKRWNGLRLISLNSKLLQSHRAVTAQVTEIYTLYIQQV